jgi:competence protein ComEC
MPGWALPVVAAGMWLGILAEGNLGHTPGMAGAAAMIASGLVGVVAGIAVLDPGGEPHRRGDVTKSLAWGMVVVSFALLGSGWAALREARVLGSPLAGLGGHAAIVVASVQEAPRAGRFGWTATMTAQVVSLRQTSLALAVSDPLWVEGRGPPPSLRPGDLVRVEGPLSVPVGAFGTWLRHRGYPAILSADRIQRVGFSGGPFRRAALALREAVARSARRVLPPSEASLLMGLALGDTSRQGAGVQEEFRATGLSHLTAVSGENLAMFLAPIMGLVGLGRLGRRTRLAIGAGSVAFFVLLAGAEPSVLRAAAMTGLSLLGMFLGRPRSPPAILGAAVCFLLVVNPTLVYSIGFQLSVAATGGIALMAQPVADRLRFLPESLALAAASTLAAQVGVAPLLLYHFGLVPLVGLPANLLAFPAVAPAMLLGLLSATVACAIPALGGGLAILARIPLAYLLGVAHRLAQVPLPSVTSPLGGMARLAAGFGLVLLVAWWIRSGAPLPRRARLAAGLILPAYLWMGALRAGAPPTLTVTFFYVGWGDGALVRSPGGATVLIDGGADLELVARKLAAWGVKRLDVLVATHAHQDHVGGLPAVLVRFPVGLVLDPGCPGEAPAYADFLRAVGGAGISIGHPRPGAGYRVADLTVEVLSPSHCFHGTNSDPNNDSLVLRLVAGNASVLFTGDVEQPAQEELLDTRGSRLVATVLKVPHHGGATTLDEFFHATNARVAVISVGPNRYGHPAPEIVAELIQEGMRVFRTDRDGDVTVVFRGGEVQVRTDA